MKLEQKKAPRKKKSFTISETAYNILIDASKKNDISVSEALSQIVENAEKKAKARK